MIPKEPHDQRKRLVVPAGGVHSNYLSDYAATGFVLGPNGDPVPGATHCENCGIELVTEFC